MNDDFTLAWLNEIKVICIVVDFSSLMTVSLIDNHFE